MTTSADSSPRSRTTSVVLTSTTHERLRDHLDRPDGQEDLCFALWRPSTGATRDTAIMDEVILPDAGDRTVHGNVSFNPRYLLRAASHAARSNAGLALLHSHPRGKGWQGMSPDDVDAERSNARQTKAMTGLPLLGMTLGTEDAAWSARMWDPGRGVVSRREAESVRVVGGRFGLTVLPGAAASSVADERLLRTVTAWGKGVQANLGELRVGVIGAGSVGAIVAEALARIGVKEIVLIDFDAIERHNLDRLLHASPRDVRLAKSKVESLRVPLRAAATHPTAKITALEASIVESSGTSAALDCDVLFSCVDRPWPRAHLNAIAYAHCIPVIDGGIRVGRTASGRMASADWRAHVAVAGRPCLACLGQYEPADAAAEREGTLDDPAYIAALPADHPLRGRQNVFAFAASCASLEIGQFVSMIAAPGGIADVGPQLYHATTGTLEPQSNLACGPNCPYDGDAVGRRGDSAPVGRPSAHPAAERALAQLAARRRRLPTRIRRNLAGALGFVEQLALGRM
jgi:molybdopterin-synthase adenylyltransferase